MQQTSLDNGNGLSNGNGAAVKTKSDAPKSARGATRPG